MYSYKANWVRVIDGDTLILNVDLGLQTFHIGTFRLKDIDMPEVRGPLREHGMRAKEALERLLLQGNLRVETHKPDKFGRWLAVLFVEQADGTELNVNQVLASMDFSKDPEDDDT